MVYKTKVLVYIWGRVWCIYAEGSGIYMRKDLVYKEKGLAYEGPRGKI